MLRYRVNRLRDCVSLLCYRISLLGIGAIGDTLAYRGGKPASGVEESSNQIIEFGSSICRQGQRHVSRELFRQPGTGVLPLHGFGVGGVENGKIGSHAQKVLAYGQRQPGEFLLIGQHIVKQILICLLLRNRIGKEQLQIVLQLKGHTHRSIRRRIGLRGQRGLVTGQQILGMLPVIGSGTILTVIVDEMIGVTKAIGILTTGHQKIFCGFRVHMEGISHLKGGVLIHFRWSIAKVGHPGSAGYGNILLLRDQMELPGQGLVENFRPGNIETIGQVGIGFPAEPGNPIQQFDRMPLQMASDYVAYRAQGGAVIEIIPQLLAPCMQTHLGICLLDFPAPDLIHLALEDGSKICHRSTGLA